MECISDGRRVGAAWSRQYARLAEDFASVLPSTTGTVVEIGSGRGQLTVPLAGVASGFQLVAVDQYEGPYARDRTALVAALAHAGLKRRVRVVESDGVNWLSWQRSSAYSAVLSSELLPELDSSRMGEYFVECYRVLECCGVVANSFLSPTPRNRRQALVIEADSDPRWTRFPPQAWFSPTPELVVRQMNAAGFRRIGTRVLPSNLRLKGAAALSLLRQWNVRPAFWRHYEGRLGREGIEIPDWVAISGRRPR